MPDHADHSSRPAVPAPFLWPLIVTASASGAAASFLQALSENWLSATDNHCGAPEPRWSTANSVALELSSMRLREFSTGTQGQPTLVCAPYALHGATIADFAPGHSLVEVLRRAGLSRVFVTDWRSATPDMRFFSIDNYLSDLNVAVDEFKPPVDLVGLCQGGWLALVYAARFPEKIRRLVLAGAPVDFHASESHLSRAVANVPLAAFEQMVRIGEGRVLGRHVLDAWAPAFDAGEADRVLQIRPGSDARSVQNLETRFRDWFAWTVDLPGLYYLQVIDFLYKQNQIAEGRFVARSPDRPGRCGLATVLACRARRRARRGRAALCCRAACRYPENHDRNGHRTMRASGTLSRRADARWKLDPDRTLAVRRSAGRDGVMSWFARCAA